MCQTSSFFNIWTSTGASSGTHRIRLSEITLSEVEYLYIWHIWGLVPASPSPNNQADETHNDKCNWIIFKCLFHIGSWIQSETSYFDPRLSKRTSPSLKSMKFCHRFQQCHDLTSRALPFIFLNATFISDVPSKFLESFTAVTSCLLWVEEVSVRLGGVQPRKARSGLC